MSDKLREIVATINNCCNNRLSIVDNTVATIFVIDHPAEKRPPPHGRSGTEQEIGTKTHTIRQALSRLGRL